MVSFQQMCTHIHIPESVIKQPIQDRIYLSIGRENADYEMDPEIVNSPEYNDLIIPSQAHQVICRH